MGRPGRFVGVGIDVYENHQPLAHAVAEVKAVAEVLAEEFAGEPLLDPDQRQVTEYFETVPGCLDTGSLVLLWCGHGVLSRSKLRLPTRRGEIDAAEVIFQCVKSGANQLLFIVDTCQAGAGVHEASVIASALLEDLSATTDHAWFGILVSCSTADIGARDGAFGKALLQLLSDGPRSADMRRRWSRHNRLIRGDDLGQALLEDWAERTSARIFCVGAGPGTCCPTRCGTRVPRRRLSSTCCWPRGVGTVRMRVRGSPAGRSR